MKRDTLISAQASASRDTAVSAHATALPADPPEWVHLFPLGNFVGRDGRGPWRIKDPAAVIAATAVDRLVIDLDHATFYGGKVGQPAPAAGWIVELQARDNGIWGRVDWTETGAQRIRQREYRFLSPVFRFDSKTGDVRALEHASLCNAPNLELQAVASQGDDQMNLEELLRRLAALFALPGDSDAAAIVAHAQSLVETDTAARVAVGAIGKIVGTAADADPTVVAQAVQTKLEAGGDPDPAAFVPMGQFTEISTKLAELSDWQAGQRAEVAVNAAEKDGKVSPGMRDWAMEYAKKDSDGFTAWAKAAPAILALGANSAGRGAPGGGDGVDDTEREVCSALGLDQEAFKKTRAADEVA